MAVGGAVTTNSSQKEGLNGITAQVSKYYIEKKESLEQTASLPLFYT